VNEITFELQGHESHMCMFKLCYSVRNSISYTFCSKMFCFRTETKFCCDKTEFRILD